MESIMEIIIIIETLFIFFLFWGVGYINRVRYNDGIITSLATEFSIQNPNFKDFQEFYIYFYHKNKRSIEESRNYYEVSRIFTICIQQYFDQRK
jgi:hypothetical protein